MKVFRTFAASALLLAACSPQAGSPKRPRLCLFVGFDVSGSFLKSPYYEDAVQFLSQYLSAHLTGAGGLDVPDALFVGPVGGKTGNEAKTFFPKQTFEGKSPDELAAKIRELFPNKEKDDYTDFNIFFSQVADTVKEKYLVLRPIVLVLLSDGIPSTGKKPSYRELNLNPLENLSRNVTVRLLYTDAVTGKKWRDEAPRRRGKVWTQDAKVMTGWKDPAVWEPSKAPADQAKFFAWVKDNVDFPVRSKRVN